jgi:hypothetical protein
MMNMLVGGSAIALMSLNGLLFSLIILAVSQGVSVFARRAHAPMQPEQWVRLYWEDQGFIACDGAGAEQRVDVKALLLSPVVIVLAVRVRHKVVATPVIFRAAIDATAFRRGFVFLKYQGM